jgi:hypothetical protein
MLKKIDKGQQLKIGDKLIPNDKFRQLSFSKEYYDDAIAGLIIVRIAASEKNYNKYITERFDKILIIANDSGCYWPLNQNEVETYYNLMVEDYTPPPKNYNRLRFINEI